MSVWGYISKTMLLIFLGAGAFIDAKTKKIPVLYAVIGAAAGVALKIFEGNLDILQTAGGFLVGVILYLLSIISKQAIGSGDGMVLAVTGIVLGFMGNIILLFSSLLAAGLYSGLMLALKKIKKKSSIPFIPFMLVGYDVLLIVFSLNMWDI